LLKLELLLLVLEAFGTHFVIALDLYDLGSTAIRIVYLTVKL
jgi:hypothetical protein